MEFLSSGGIEILDFDFDFHSGSSCLVFHDEYISYMWFVFCN